jgi:alpha-D-ribose 1-methylphosphonate 5-triphosphate synthase subunit PhnH
MNAELLAGGFPDTPVEAARAFRAAMTAMARPGTIVTLDGAAPPAPLSPAAGALILTLCDGDTVLHLAGSQDTDAVRAWVAFHTGAPIGGARDADFAVGTWAALAPLDRYRIGTPDYPDRSATLIVEMADLQAEGVRLTGPGIRDVAHLNLPDAPAFAGNAARFPLGWDAYLTCGHRAAAIPRSTRIG